jgi:ADP-ribosylglycohydrolase
MTQHQPTTGDRLALARASLEGLSVGDAFGEGFFDSPRRIERMLATRTPPRGEWPFTDDTVMALSVVDVLEHHGRIDQDELSRLFADRYAHDRGRGYGGTAHRILERILTGEHWRDVSASVFEGTGSMGNGGAMRSAPVGAYFFDDLDRVVDEARKSAEVTHGHPEGQAGAIAVAVAAAWVAAGGDDAADLFDCVLTHTPSGVTREGIERASRMPLTSAVGTAVEELGNGSQIISPDTVPFCIWSTARHLSDYEEAMWETVSGRGDRDTTCAIVGGVVALHRDAEIPNAWRDAREALDTMSRERLQPRE